MTAPTKTHDKTSATKSSTAQSATDAKHQDAVALLKQDHRLVEELFSQFESSTSKDRKAQIVTEFCPG
jgi:hypothetical protein